MYISRRMKIIIISIFVLFVFLFSLFFILNTFKKDKLVAKNYNVEAGKDIDALSLVKLQEGYEEYIVTAKKEKITLDKTGKTKITYYIRKKGESKKEKIDVSFNVIDTTPPVISTEDVLSVAYDSTFNINNLIKVNDNVDKNIKDVSFTGKVNTKKIGTYDIVVTAKDSSGNSSSKNVSISVVKAYLPYEDISNLGGKWLNKDNDLILSFFNSYGRSGYTLSVKGENLNYNGYVSSITKKGKNINLIVSYNASDWQEGESPDYKFAKMTLVKEDNKIILKNFMAYKNINFLYAGKNWQDVDEKYK